MGGNGGLLPRAPRADAAALLIAAARTGLQPCSLKAGRPPRGSSMAPRRTVAATDANASHGTKARRRVYGLNKAGV